MANEMIYASVGMGFAIGVISAITVVIAWKIWSMYREKFEKPHIILINMLTFKPNHLGTFEKIRKITIPVDSARNKTFWAIETNAYIILPAYGNREDMLIEDPSMPRLKFLFAEVIGTGSEGEDVQREWCRYALPEEVYEIPTVLEDVPSSYVFVKPIFKRSWMKQFLRQGIGEIKAIYGEYNRAISIYERQLETVHSNYGDLIMTRVDSASQLVLSLWYHVLKTWDVISEYKVLPIAVMCRLLHIPMDKLNYTGLTEAVQHGNMREVGAEIIGSYRDALVQLNEQFGMTPINKEVAQTVFNRVNYLTDRLGESMQREQQLESQALSNLIRQVQTQPQLQAPSEKRPVMNMYEE